MKQLMLVACLSMTLGACSTLSAAQNDTKIVVYKQSATASWYQHGKRTANGEHFNPNGDTVAHRTLPFGTKLRLTNLSNQQTIIARVNDRGPFIKGTELDVARGGAQRLGFLSAGKAKLRIEVLH